MSKDASFRRAEDSDLRPAYAVFRRSLLDYLLRLAVIDEETAKNDSVDAAWQRQSQWIVHLWNTAAENWVAVDASGAVIGWAMSVARDGHLELTHFFVEPGIQSKGVGRGLIECAFPGRPGLRKSIAATQDPRALSLYLRAGVNYVTTAGEFVLAPRRRAPAADIAFQNVKPTDESVEAIAGIERGVLGFRRDADIRFLLGQRPAWLALRDGEPVGFAFGAQSGATGDAGLPAPSGPMAALDPNDVPALIDHVTSEAEKSGIGDISVLAPFANQSAVRHLLARGAKIDPFYIKVLASDGDMKLDRWLHTMPMFIL